MRFIARFLGLIFATFAIVFVVGAVGAGAVLYKYEQDLPDYTQLKNYEPPVDDPRACRRRFGARRVQP